MNENPGDHSGMFNSGNDLLGATSAMVVFSWVKTRSGLKWQLNHSEELLWCQCMLTT
jgi:hypothetical protein